MNDNIDVKLNKAVMETIWIRPIPIRDRVKVHPNWFVANGQSYEFGIDLERIKLILKDAVRSGNNYGNFEGHLMTGQEWNARFEKELNSITITVNGVIDSGVTTRNVSLRAARRAAGIDSGGE